MGFREERISHVTGYSLGPKECQEEVEILQLEVATRSIRPLQSDKSVLLQGTFFISKKRKELS